MSKQFYKTTITVEVLSEEPLPPDISLRDIGFGITEGDWSGEWEVISVEPLDGAQAARALEAQGSDAGFFGLTSEGKEVE